MNKPVNLFSKIVSTLFVPPIVTTLIMLAVIYYETNNPGQNYLKLVHTFTFGFIAPLVYFFILRKLRIVNDNDASNKTERFYPYLGGSIICLFASAISYYYFDLSLYTVCWVNYFSIYLLLLLINNWWKISSHTTNLAVAIPILISINSEYVYVFVLLLIILSFARLVLKAHTIPQVIGGALFGIIITIVNFEILL
ncbi:MAG: hypothetical protein JEY94_17050 [Melioribacteraceae bacterium]|nr:hypothetical protein [Melioribacteraceae bacterium]